jgi:hypothetical protein
MPVTRRFLHRRRATAVVALLLGAAGVMLLGTTRVSANPFPIATANPAVMDFPLEPPHRPSHAKTVTITAGGVGLIGITAVRITAGAREDFRIASTTCEKAILDPGQSCTVSLIFRPVTIWRKPRAILSVSTNSPASPLDVPLIGAVRWALRLSSYPQNSTGSPVIVKAVANNQPHAIGLDINMFVDGKFSTACAASSCLLSISAMRPGSALYRIAADVGRRRARPGSPEAVISRHRRVSVHYTPPNCLSGNCT